MSSFWYMAAGKPSTAGFDSAQPANLEMRTKRSSPMGMRSVSFGVSPARLNLMSLLFLSLGAGCFHFFRQTHRLQQTNHVPDGVNFPPVLLKTGGGLTGMVIVMPAFSIGN